MHARFKLSMRTPPQDLPNKKNKEKGTNYVMHHCPAAICVMSSFDETRRCACSLLTCALQGSQRRMFRDT